MRLAFCLFKYFPFGGLQRDFWRIADECIQRGHTIDVYTMKWDSEPDPRFKIHVLAQSARQNHTRNKEFADQLQTHLQKQNYDLVIGFNKMPGLDVYYAADICYQAKARTQRSAWYRLLPRYRCQVELEKSVFAKEASTEILMLSKAQQPEFEHYYKTQKNRFHLLPPGIAKDRIAPANADEVRAAVRQEFNISQNDYILLFLGSGFKTKGLDRALQSIAALPDDLKSKTHFFIIGKDNPSSFQQLAKKLGITQQIHFMGGRHDVPRFLLAADLLLHPAYNENTGTALLEAIVSGLPVLTTDACGYADYVREAQAGQVVTLPFQQKQFNQSVAAMLLSPEKNNWRKNGIAFANQADIYSMPVRAVDIIEKLRK